MTRPTAQQLSRFHGVSVRVAARRMLRSLNSLGVIVADSVPPVRDNDATNRPAVFARLH